MAIRKKNIGSNFDDWLKDEGIYEESTEKAVKRVLAMQLEDMMQEKHLTKTDMAKRMDTSRAAVNRLLDPENESVTLYTLKKAAAVLGKKLRLEFA
ncbi:MAG: XRE family transcriptional regulator [Deltaproteobacteria bacterium]|nr:XRE family transcriptional regulator [Deltaproteobacteria bacterium]